MFDWLIGCLVSGYRTHVVLDGCRGLADSSIVAAKEKWAAAGVELCNASDIPAAAVGMR